LALTGFEVHGVFDFFGYNKAVLLHDRAAYIYMGLLVFTLFWIFFTGEWHQYVPTREHISEQVTFYMKGIFSGAEHPTHKSIVTKFNSLQKATYFVLKFGILPAMVVTGLLYSFRVELQQIGFIYPLAITAYVHTTGAIFLMGFVIGHVYLTTTGYKPFSAIKAMITGWEDMSEAEAEIATKENIAFLIKGAQGKIVDRNFNIDKDRFQSVFETVACNYGMAKTELQKQLESAHVGYFRLDAEGKYLEVNNIWKQLYECTEFDNPIGLHHTLNRMGDAKKAVEKVFDLVFNKGRTLTGVNVTRFCVDGTKRHHTISANPVYKGAKIIGIEGYIIDLPGQ